MAVQQLKELQFVQYKRFSGNESLEIKPVTILVGKNSSGKSSITKLMPVLAKSVSGDLKKSIMLLDTDGVSLGVSYQSLCHNGNTVGLGFGMKYANDVEIFADLIANHKDEIQISRYIVQKAGTKHELRLAPDRVNYICNENDKEYLASEFSGFIHKAFLQDIGVDLDLAVNIDYIGPLRCEPSRTYYYTGSELSDKVEARGDNAYQLLCADDELVHKVSDWFERNFNGCRLQVVSGGERGSYIIKMNKPDNGDYWVNIADEGMGMSQVLPIVVRSIHSVDNSIVVVEQPELHLHPAAHEAVAKLFAVTSKQNNQRYIVETHSENILLGLRAAVVDQSIDFTSDDILIYFVDEDDEGAYLKKITIDADGMLSSWPEGVFNESYELLNKIIAKTSNQINV